jgi:hypothetical protein
MSSAGGGDGETEVALNPVVVEFDATRCDADEVLELSLSRRMLSYIALRTHGAEWHYRHEVACWFGSYGLCE